MSRCLDCGGVLRPHEFYWCDACYEGVRTHCGHCGCEMEPDPSGSCSARCEAAYGECSKCVPPNAVAGSARTAASPRAPLRHRALGLGCVASGGVRPPAHPLSF